MLLLQARLVLRLRAHQSRSQDGGAAVGQLAGGPVRLFPYPGRPSRRSGRIHARAACRRRADQGAEPSDRRAGAVPVRHLSDRLHGGRLLQYPARGHDRRLGLRPGGADGDQERLPARRRARAGGRYGTGTDGARANLRRRNDRLHEGGCLRAHHRPHARPRRRCLHRRSRHRAENVREPRLSARSCQGRAVHGHRPAARAAAGDPLLPQLRHRVDRRRLRRLRRQRTDGLGHQSRPDLPHGPDAGPALHAQTARAHRARRDRSLLRHHSPRLAGRRPATVQHLSRQEGRLHQGGHEAMSNPSQATDAMDANRSARPFAIVTGASTGIGLELAKQCAAHGFDLLIAADEPAIEEAGRMLQGYAGIVEWLVADLSAPEGVDKLLERVRNRPVDALLANAGRGLGRAFLDQDFADIRHVVDTNIIGTLYLIHRVAREMRNRGRGRILITGSIAGFMPGTYQAVYNGTKSFLDMFSYALRAELAECDVSVTCLMPGATETEFFERADMMDTKVGAEKKTDPAEVAEMGFRAMMEGEGGVIVGWQNKLQVAIAKLIPQSAVARIHERQAAPGTAKNA